MPNPNILSSSTTIISGVPAKDTTRIYSMPTFAKNLPSEVISPHPLLAYTDNELLRMIMQDGLKAYGLYWLVMEKLYQQPQHFLAPQTASFIQNLYDVSDELMESVLYNYGLFYLDEKMNLHSKAIDDYREALDNMEDEKKRNTKPHVNNSLKANGNAEDFNTREIKKTSNIQKNPSPIINKEINKKNSSSEESGKEKEEENGLKVTDLNAVTPDMRPNAWEENLQEAMNDTSWYEVVAIQSGIPRLMMEEKEWFFNYLREQIILRGNESSMNSLHEIKKLFRQSHPAGKPCVIHNAGGTEEVSQKPARATAMFALRNHHQRNTYLRRASHPRLCQAATFGGTYLESGDERMDTIAYYLSIIY